MNRVRLEHGRNQHPSTSDHSLQGFRELQAAHDAASMAGWRQVSVLRLNQANVLGEESSMEVLQRPSETEVLSQDRNDL